MLYTALLPVIIFLSSLFVTDDGLFSSYTVDVKKQTLRTYWKTDSDERLKSLSALQTYIRSGGHRLLFGMNCGMYTEDRSPVGLYIEKGKRLSSLKRCNNKKANFCLQPQGVFYITRDKKAGISTVDNFTYQNIDYAIEAAPMIVLDGKENSSLPKQSRFIRNGAGVRKDGKVVLAISKRPVTFSQLARYFISQGCTNAVYFDGGVSKALLADNTIIPEGRSTRGGFGAMIAVSE